MKLVVIEGNIGSGKSTLLPNLEVAMEELTGEKWQTLVEPVDTDPEFHRLLKQFIANPTDGDLRAEFQLYMTRSRHTMLQDIPDGNYILERSLFSDLVFTHTNFLSTSCPSGSYINSYWDIVKHLESYPKPDVMVYLSRDPEACMESAMERDRDGESSYELHYFEDLHRFHLACLPQITRQYKVPYVEVGLRTAYPEAYDIAFKIIREL